MKINSFHTIGYTCQNFIRNRAQNIRQDCNRQIITEYNDLISFTTINVRYINHANIHADIAYIRSFLSIHQAISIAISQSSLQEFDAYKAACIAIGYDADPEETPITYAANGPDAYFLELAISKDVFYIHLTARK